MIRRTLAALMMLAAGVYAASETQPATQAATAPHPVELLAEYPKHRMPKNVHSWTQLQADALRQWVVEAMNGKAVQGYAQVVRVEKRGGTRHGFYEVKAKTVNRSVWGAPFRCQIEIAADDIDSVISYKTGTTIMFSGVVRDVSIRPPSTSSRNGEAEKVPGEMRMIVVEATHAPATMPSKEAAKLGEARVISGMTVRDAIAAMGRPAISQNNAKDKTQALSWFSSESPEWAKTEHEYGHSSVRITATVKDGVVDDVFVEPASDIERERYLK